MTPLRLSVVALLALGACTRHAPQTPAIEPAARPAVVVVEDVPVVVDAPAVADDVPAVAVDAPAAPSPDAVLLRGLADGSVDLAAHVDPAHGVVLVTFLEATPDGRSPARRTSRRVCGAAVTRDAALRTHLREAIAQSATNDALLCDGDECVVPGMEYQPSYRLRLGRRADGARVLLGAMQVSEAALGDEWLARSRAYVAQALAAARARPCRP